MAVSRRTRRFTPLCWVIAVLALLFGTTTAPAIADTSWISLDKTAYAPGDAIKVTYSTTQPSPTNWIGIYADGGSGLLKWDYAPGTSPYPATALTLWSTGLPTGGYQAYYYYNNGYTQLGSPMHFWVTDRTTITPSTTLTPSLKLDKNVYAPGDTVKASYRAPDRKPDPGGTGACDKAPDTNWIGIYKDTDPPPDGTTWSSAWCSAPYTAGTVSLPTSKLPAGGYVAYLLASGGYSTKMSSSPAPHGTYSDPVHFWIGSAPQGTVPRLDHVFVVMMENKAPRDIFGSTTNNMPNPTYSAAPAPYLDQLAFEHVTLTNSHGIHHPSDPNYIALAGGETYLKDNEFPTHTGVINANHLGTLVESVGKTWKGYMEDMRYPCDLQKHDSYDPDDLPFLFFRDMTDTTRCRNHLQPITQMWSDLKSASTTPNFVWFEPNSDNTMHNNCSPSISTCVTAGDNWMNNNLPTILNSPAFTQQRSLLIITWDEDNSWTSANPIPTILVGSPGLTISGTPATPATSNTWYNHYNVTATIEDALSVPFSLTANDANAISIQGIWK